MRVSQLNEMVDIDMSIQSLLSDLQELYTKRQSIVESSSTGKTKRRTGRNKAVNINNINFDDFDLSLT